MSVVKSNVYMYDFMLKLFGKFKSIKNFLTVLTLNLTVLTLNLTVLTLNLTVLTLNLTVVVFVFNVPPTAKVIWRWGHGLKSHPTDW